MFERLRWGGVVAAVLALSIAVLGAVPALAEGETTYLPAKAMLTKVIVAPAGTDASGDSYVFKFAGGGTVDEQKDDSGNTHVYSDGIEQDVRTIKGGDIVPAIPDVTLEGEELTDNISLIKDQQYQTVVQKSILSILSENKAAFPHAGIYTYVVTETSAQAQASDCYINTSSKAEYILRIRVKNSSSNNASNSYQELQAKGLEIDGITVQQTKDDYGTPLDNAPKVDPTYPTTDDGGKIEYIAENTPPASNELAGDSRGFNVAGFTFANEYIKSAPFQVKKLYNGSFSDKTKKSTVELTIHSTGAVTAVGEGSALTYRIEGGGTDSTENAETLNDGKMVEFDSNGWAYIKAELMEGSSIRITGMLGPLSGDERETISTVGLTSGLEYTVIEGNPIDYRPTGYVYIGTGDVDPRTDAGKNARGMSEPVGVTDVDTVLPYNNQFKLPQGWELINGGSQFKLPPFAFFLTGSTTGSDTTVFVVNTMDDNKVTPTGIFIDNLPYILMVGIPVAVFAGMFVMKCRGNAAA